MTGALKHKFELTIKNTLEGKLESLIHIYV